MALCILSVVACADTETPEPANGTTDTGSERDVGATTDTGIVDTTPEDTTPPPDTTPPDTSVIVDTGPEVVVGECVAFSVNCTEDGLGIRRCSALGDFLDPSPCPDLFICDAEANVPECVACTAGVNCPDEDPTCEANANFCLDFETVASCSPEGTVDTERTAPCTPRRCVNAACTSGLGDTGDPCTADGDCAGLTCLCAATGATCENAADCRTGECSGGSCASAPGDSDFCAAFTLAAGFCTTGNCGANGCEPATEVCADFSLGGQNTPYGGREVCILRGDCSVRGGDCSNSTPGDGHVCREVPTAEGGGQLRNWQLACAVPAPSPAGTCDTAACLSSIGGACNTDSDCIGGNCERVNGVSYCTAVCNETASCPSYARCVQPDGLQPNEFRCLAIANSESCPRLSTFDILPVDKPIFGGGGTARVCWPEN